MKLKAADLFCGAGGTSTGLVEACQELGHECDLTAINHWEVAVATHTQNHPDARHLCASLDALNPRDLYGEGELDILWASPECTHHSIARGGKPINDQSRATAWCVVRWAEALRPSIILIENVKEFVSWGAIGTDGRPLKTKKGEVFSAWVSCLESLGYRVDWRVLCAADYGDPTTRKRLFVYAVRGRRKIVWPEPTHAPVATEDMFGARKRWVPARDIIDWKLEGKSIYGRKKPLADKTLNRIMIGLERFGLKPFTIHMEHQGSVRSFDLPLPTITTAKGGAMAVAEPYLVHLRGNCDAKDLDKPAPALTAGGGHLGLCEPYLIQCAHGNGGDINGDGRRVRGTHVPLPTVAGNRGEWALCEPFVIGQQSGAQPRPASEPLPTVATSGAISLVQPFIVPQFNGAAPQSVHEPLGTITTTSRGIRLVQPCLVSFYGKGDAQSVDKPLPTVTTKDRFGLVMPTVEIHGEKYLLDIRFRMLKPHELAAAQGFPRGYKFTGNTTQVVKQIGNAVPKNLAKALVRAALTQRS
ncbi:MAG TPA: DNA cytosine methyltransferase [Verrucomicrobiae bacterium]|nr:DNA cytosine methyltransferase [Verrucomicrobiae bacterium]